AHGTVRSLPAKSIEGASPSVPWSKLSEPGNCGAALERPPTVPAPLVVHAPLAKDRAKIWSCGGVISSVSRWRKIAHGAAGSSLTCRPAGSGWNAQTDAVIALSATASAAARSIRLAAGRALKELDTE